MITAATRKTITTISRRSIKLVNAMYSRQFYEGKDHVCSDRVAEHSHDDSMDGAGKNHDRSQVDQTRFKRFVFLVQVGVEHDQQKDLAPPGAVECPGPDHGQQAVLEDRFEIAEIYVFSRQGKQ